jgi:segregation and condensation protein B
MTSETDAATRGSETTVDPASQAAEAPEVSVSTPLDVPGQPRLDLDRAIEAILFIADEPQSLVHLAAAVQRPLAEVRAAIARLREDYDGGAPSGEPRTDEGESPAGGGIRRASNCARSAVAGASTRVPSTTGSSPTSSPPRLRRGSRRPRSRPSP